jgi:hypothetical protein
LLRDVAHLGPCPDAVHGGMRGSAPAS